MALMPRGEPRSVPDPAGDAYDEMVRGLREGASSPAYRNLLYRSDEDQARFSDLAYRPDEMRPVFMPVDARQAPPIDERGRRMAAWLDGGVRPSFSRRRFSRAPGLEIWRRAVWDRASSTIAY